MTSAHTVHAPRPHRSALRLLVLGSLALLLAGVEGCSLPGFPASPTPTATAGTVGNGSPRVVSTIYPTDDLVVATQVATDAPYRADPTGAREAGVAIQEALDDCHRAGGGVVWLPAGTYRVSSSLYIPPHVTLRGDWRDPDSGSGRYGTVILATVPSGGETDPGLFRISGSAGVNGLTVYYPNQSAANPTPYPYTFEILGALFDGDGQELASINHVTLLDAYRGISAGADAVHDLHFIRHVRGTALLTGLYLYDSSDTSRNEDIAFNGSYWAHLDPSVASARPTEAQVDAWTQAHATGLVMGGLDGDFFGDLSFADFDVGIDMVAGRRMGMAASLFGISVAHGHIGLHVHGELGYLDPGFGLAIANSTFQADPGAGSVAVLVTGDNPTTNVLLNRVTLGGGAATALQVAGNVYVQCNSCTFDGWSGPYAVVANRGTLALEGSTFGPALSATTRGIQLLPGLSSATLLGTSFTGSPTALVDDTSGAPVARQDGGFLFVKDPVTTYTFHTPPRPSSTRFFNVRAAPYRARANGVADDTAAIQHALDDAGKAGGGTVYLPAGIYAVRGHLSVPAGVELRGSDDGPHHAATLEGAAGTILFAYEGRATPTPDQATPFILLDGNHAGVRGLGVHYPEQATDSPAHIVAYPWTIRGRGAGVYAFDIALTDAYQGIDFATSPTDGHYLGGIIGFALQTGLQVGNASMGWVEDVSFNMFAWYAAFGLPNSLDPNNLVPVAAAYSGAHGRGFVVTSGAQDEQLANDFPCGSHTGFTFEADARVVAFNLGADCGPNAIAVTGTGPGGLTLVNMQDCGGCIQNDAGSGGVGVEIDGGTVDAFNTIVSFGGVTLPADRVALRISGGSYQLEGAACAPGFAVISGGTGVLAGAFFPDTGTQVTVSGANTIANLWGDVGQGGFTATYVDGAPALVSGDIPR